MLRIEKYIFGINIHDAHMQVVCILGNNVLEVSTPKKIKNMRGFASQGY